MSFQKTKPMRLSRAKFRKVCEQAYERDGGRCVFCGASEGLTPAHIVRKSQGGDDSLENIMAACINCHSALDQYRKELPEKVWARMSIEHREEYVMTRRNLKWRSE